ncbi:putative amino acid permease-like protein [Trypanosoma theileri]|uniref:Putative amino acid permease-like protein n=1 Tax=Trypanosoma theileri TaxID=67003 RepID=A0A1X0P0B5_9TRYP|nr:putative amino acid permease-like protein [Trypanosoma theileri]ORC90386.1 putative amino acid permease-like protein [Trypanosoma theileri]
MNSLNQPLVGDSFSVRESRHSLPTRISSHVARRLSVIGVVEAPRHGTIIAASINTLCNVIGAGVLSLPLAMYEASVAGAVVLMVYTAILAGFSTFAVVVGCEATQRFSFTEVFAFILFPSLTFEEYCGNTSNGLSEDYIEADKGGLEMEILFAQYTQNEVLRRKRRRIVTVMVELIVFLNNYGALIIYARVIADSIPPVVKGFLNASGFVATRNFWLIISGVVFFLLSCIRNMEELKWTSLVGFLTILYIVIAVVARFFTSQREKPYPNVDPKERGEINWYHVGVGIFRTMSTYGVAFAYHYNVPYFYRELAVRTPKNMMKSVYITFPVIFICYLSTGIFGYLTFGNLVSHKDVGGDIVRNYPNDDTVMNIGRLGLFLHFACVYPILSVCARRGLHRLIMHALTWCEHTERMEEEREIMHLAYQGGENVAPNRSIGTAETHIDRDVGSPEDTTFLAIVIEAFFIVSTTIVLASFISGISMVINFSGTLLGIFLMLTGPGIIAWFVFSRSRVMGFTSYKFTRLLMGFSILHITTGIVFTIVGTAFIIKSYVT